MHVFVELIITRHEYASGNGSLVVEQRSCFAHSEFISVLDLEPVELRAVDGTDLVSVAVLAYESDAFSICRVGKAASVFKSVRDGLAFLHLEKHRSLDEAADLDHDRIWGDKDDVAFFEADIAVPVAVHEEVVYVNLAHGLSVSLHEDIPEGTGILHAACKIQEVEYGTEG